MRTRAGAMMVSLSPDGMRRMLWETGNRALGDERMERVPEIRDHVAEYVGALFGHIDNEERDYDSWAAAGLVKDSKRPQIDVGKVMFATSHAVKAEFGDPTLAGVDCPAAPQDYVAAVNAHEAVQLVQGHLIEALYDAGLAQPSKG